MTASDCLERAERWIAETGRAKKGWICFLGMADWESQGQALEEDYFIKRICPIKIEHPGYPKLLRMYFVIERKRPVKKEAF